MDLEPCQPGDAPSYVEGMIADLQARHAANIASWGPDCRRCHDKEFRVDGYCSVACRDMHDVEIERDEYKAIAEKLLEYAYRVPGIPLIELARVRQKLGQKITPDWEKRLAEGEKATW